MFLIRQYDTSPSYLLFQTLLPLFWTLTCMISMELTRTNAVFSRIAMVLFLGTNTSSRIDLKIYGEYFWNKKNNGARTIQRGSTPCPRGWEARLPPGCAPCFVGPLVLHRPQLQLYIFTFGEKKKTREKDSSRFTIRSRHQAVISLGRADLESVRGSGEGDSSPSSSSTILHHQFHDAHRRA